MIVLIRRILTELRLLRGSVLTPFLKNNSFSIISDNCWGGFVYQYFNLPYRTPFVGLFVFSPDYIKMLSDLKFYLSCDINFIPHQESKYKSQLIEYGTFGKYPIGLLGGDIEIHFLHYENESEAKLKWQRRLKRVDYDNLIIKFCDRDLCSEDLIRKFFLMNYEKKIFLTSKCRCNAVNLKLMGEDDEEVRNEWASFKRTKNILFFINDFY
jgi:uncharacterized protein (DUF1919 family)